MQKGSGKLRLIVLSGLAISLLFFYWHGFVFSQGDPSSPAPPLPGTNFQVCTGLVGQDACYNEATSITRLNWNYSSPIDPVTGSGGHGQMAFWVQVDDNGNLNDGNFPSLEVNTGWITSSNQHYDILPGFLNPNTAYAWKVAVAATNGTWSGWTCADVTFNTPPSCVPDAPTNLQITEVTCSTVGLSWDDNSYNENGFKIERSPDGITWLEIATVGTNETTYQNTGLSESAQYFYRVRAYRNP